MQARLKISKVMLRNLEQKIYYSISNGNFKLYMRAKAILWITEGQSFQWIADQLKISTETIRLWLKSFMLNGIKFLQVKGGRGKPPRLTKSQKKELMKIISKSPEEAGYLGGCWRSALIQDLIKKKFGVMYSVHYIAQLLKNMGISYQKAKFVAGSENAREKVKWLNHTWPEILKLSKDKKSYIFFEDEASFAQWGSLSYTWAPKGKQPVVKTSGKRKNYKVFGMIDYWTGRFIYKAAEGRLNSETYIEYLKEVLKKTRKHIILIHDGAPYHRSKAVKEFLGKHVARVTAYRMPSYSPEYNPIEKLWKKIKEKGIHMKYFPSFDDLKGVADNMLGIFAETRDEVLSLFGFYREMAE